MKSEEGLGPTIPSSLLQAPHFQNIWGLPGFHMQRQASLESRASNYQLHPSLTSTTTFVQGQPVDSNKHNPSVIGCDSPKLGEQLVSFRNLIITRIVSWNLATCPYKQRTALQKGKEKASGEARQADCRGRERVGAGSVRGLTSSSTAGVQKLPNLGRQAPHHGCGTGSGRVRRQDGLGR